MTKATLRKQTYDILNHTFPESRGARFVDGLLIFLITLNVFAVSLETIPEIHSKYEAIFYKFELFSVAVFTIEYLIRLWVAIEDMRFEDNLSPRFSYALTPMALIDLIAILPFYLSMLFVVDLRALRILRLLRIFKFTRYSAAMSMLLDVFREEASAFGAGFFILFVLLVFASSGAYLAEHAAQPEKFGSIPAAMWWAVATLTTVGYGDVTPITVYGKIFGALVTVVGVGMAALPAGILASSLADHLHRRRDTLRREFMQALHSGEIDAEEEAELEALRKKMGISRNVAHSIRMEVLLQQVQGIPNACPHCGKSLSGSPSGPPSGRI